MKMFPNFYVKYKNGHEYDNMFNIHRDCGTFLQRFEGEIWKFWEN